MKLAITHAFCWPEVRRGAERFIQELGAALAARGHDVTVLSSGWKPGRTTLDGVTTVRLRRWRKDGFAHEADFGRRLVPRLVAGRYDAVHSLGRRDAVAAVRAAWALARLGRYRHTMRTVFTDLGNPDRAWWTGAGRREARAVERVVAGVDVYGCMSRYSLDFLPANYGRSDGVVTPGGVDLEQFRPRDREPHPTLLFSAALTEERKGLRVLLAAMSAVLEAEPECRLWLSGPGDPSTLVDAAPRAVRDRTEVLPLGDAKGYAETYARAWVTTLPSQWDSFGMCLVESLASGTPICVTTHGAPKELAQPGITGELCEPEDPAGLAAALLRSIDLARKPETAEACRASALPFDWRLSLAPAFERYYEG